MNKNLNIEKLLQKYFDGTSLLEEEKALKAYFSGDEVAEHLKQYQPLFQYFESAKSVRLEKELDEWSGGEVRQLKTKNRNIRWMSIAASMALILGLWFYQNDSISSQDKIAEIDWSKYEPENPEEAMKQTVSALKLLSSKLNGGTKAAAKELDRMIDVKDIIQMKKTQFNY